MQWVDISFVFKHVFQNNLAHLYSLKSRSAIRNKLTKDPNLKKSSFFFFLGGGGRGGGGVVGLGGVNIMSKCFEWHFDSSRNTNGPNYSEIHA